MKLFQSFKHSDLWRIFIVQLRNITTDAIKGPLCSVFTAPLICLMK